MPQTSGGLLLQAVAERPWAAVYVTCTAVTLAALTGIALRRPRVFASVVNQFALDNRQDRRLLLGAVVMWAAVWPITLVVLAFRSTRVTRGRR